MDTSSSKPSVETQIESLQERWLSSLRTPTPNKRDIVEEGISQLYRAHNMDKPLILWCQSPAQMSLIPTVVTSIVMSAGWSQLCERLSNRFEPGSSEWIDQFREEWAIIEPEFVLKPIDTIWAFKFKSLSSAIRQRIKDLIFEYMKLILLDGRVTAQSLYNTTVNTSKNLEQAGMLLPAPIDYRFQGDIAKIGLQIDSKTKSHSRPNPAAAGGLFASTFDLRSLRPQFQSLSLKFNHTKRQQKDFSQLRQKFRDFETMAAARSAWLTRTMFGTAPIFDPFEEIDFTASVPEAIWQVFSGMKEGIEREIQQPRGNIFAIWATTASWLPFALACRLVDPAVLADLEDSIDCWANLWHGAAGYMFCKEMCFVCEKPTVLSINAVGRPHNENGPAATWSDGFSVYSWRGVVVEERLVHDKNFITARKILQERNAELRRVMIDMFGDERFLKESGAELVHKDEYGELFRKEFFNDEPLVMVKVKNSTMEKDGTFTYYYLRVPPTTVTAKQAVAWTFGLDENNYRLIEES